MRATSASASGATPAGDAPGYVTAEVARMLGIPAAQVRAWVKAGLLEPRRGRRGEHRFTLPDLVLLRTARELLTHLPRRTVQRALRRLRQQLPDGRPLSGVRIVAQGGQVVVRDGGGRWEPESGQALLDFDVEGGMAPTASLIRRSAAVVAAAPQRISADGWYDIGCELEASDPPGALAAYRRAIELEPAHTAARVNLGRILHEGGDRIGAEREYREALAANPGEATAAYNLGVVLEDLGRAGEAIAAYEQAIAADPGYADAHYNAARLYEDRGDRTSAFRHLKAYRQLTQR